MHFLAQSTFGYFIVDYTQGADSRAITGNKEELLVGTVLHVISDPSA